MVGTPWNRIIRLALVATVAVVLAVLLDLEARGGNTVGLIQPGDDGPSAEVFAQDFPDLDLPDGLGHDGQQFYVVARAPMHLDEASDHLDRPRYRLQRPLFPLLAWALHPSGGGYGLVTAIAAVGAAAVFLVGLGAGALSTRLGGPAWPAIVVPVLAGGYAALRLSLADSLALGLVLLALFAVEDRRLVLAAGMAVLAVLAKESVLVVLIGHAAVRRTRAAVVAAVSGGLVAGAWWIALHMLVDADSAQVLEFTWPFGGVVRSLADWFDGHEWVAGVTVLGTCFLTAAALWRRGTRHPLFGALALSAVFSVFLGPDVIGLNFNASRTLGPLIALAVLTLATPTQDDRADLSPDARVGATTS